MCKNPRARIYKCSQSRHRPRRSTNHRYNSKSPNRSRPYRSPSRSPSCRQPRSPHHNRRNRKSPILHIHQVNHILLTAPKPNDAGGKLITDTALDGQPSFHTTLQVITKQGTKPIPVKVDPGADVNTIPLSCYKELFRKNLTEAGHIKNNVLHSTSHLWSSYDNKPQRFIGYFITDVQHKTLPKTMQVRFEVFEDITSPPILLSYPASERLGIIEFKAPNEATTPAAIGTISTKKEKSPSVHHLQAGKTKQSVRSSSTPPKSAIKNKPFQDHSSQNCSSQNYATIENKPFQDHSSQDHLWQHNSINNHSCQDHSSIKDVKDIFSLKQAFPTSFDTVGNMPGKYSIKIDSAVPPVQHTRCKVPIHYKEEIEKKLKEIEQLQIITSVTRPTEWVSSITYPTKPRWLT